MHDVAAIVLAAGLSRRMGPANKLLMQVHGSALVRGVITACAAVSSCPVTVVTGHEADGIKAVLEGFNLNIVHNQNFAEGQVTSVLAGLTHAPDASAYLKPPSFHILNHISSYRSVAIKDVTICRFCDSGFLLRRFIWVQNVLSSQLAVGQSLIHFCPVVFGTGAGLRKTTVCFWKAVLWKVRVGGPWRDLPSGFGEWNSVFRRFRRWAQRGVFQRLFEAVSGDPDFEYVLVDGTIVSVHQKAAGAKGGRSIRPSGAQRAD